MLQRMSAGNWTRTAVKGVTVKKQRLFTVAGPALIALALLLSGCYTQLATTEGEEEYSQQAPYTDDTTFVPDSTGARGYTEYRERVYFDYYYPSFAFSVGYYSPWYWGVNWWYAPYWTPYYYGYGWYAPISYPGWYYPYYSYPYYYSAPYRSAPYATRTFGNTRSVGNTRSTGATREVTGAGYSGGSMLDNMGRAAVRSGGSSSAGRVTTGVRSPSVPDRLFPTVTPRVSSGGRSNGSVRSSDSRSSEKYRPGRSYTPSHSPQGGNGRESSANPFPSYSPGTRQGGETRSGTGQSYSPPPSRGSSPPPSSGGGQGGGGGRGGNRR
jgi:hypothetical protein